MVYSMTLLYSADALPHGGTAGRDDRVILPRVKGKRITRCAMVDT
jgi:hypothetical protein